MTAAQPAAARMRLGGRPRRVLWLTKGLGRGGAEQLLVSAARRLDGDHRFALEVAYVLPHKDAFVADLQTAGVTVHCLGGPGGRGWVRALARLLHADGGFDVVHTHSPVAATAARVLAPSRSRLIHTEHNMWERYRLPTRVANAVTIGRNERVLAVSDGVADSIRPPRWLRGTTQVDTLIHGIDPDAVIEGPEARAAARAKLGLADDDVVVGTVGNLTPKKDHRTLLRALARLDGDLGRTRGVIVGDGPLADELAHEVARLGLSERVQLLGSRDDVPALLPAFDVFVMSSLHEGLSIALVEALAAGLPCVATCVGGIPEVVTDGEAGLLVPPGSPDAFATALRDVLGNRARWRAMVAAAPGHAAPFSIEPAVRRLAEIYEGHQGASS